MSENTFNGKEALKYGWEQTKKNILFFTLLLVATFIISLILNFITLQLTGEKLNVISGIIAFLFNIIKLIIPLVFIKISLNFYDIQKADFQSVQTSLALFFKFILGSLFYWLIIACGIFLLLVPGIIWGVKFQYFGYLIIDKGLHPIEAIKKSAEITNGNRTNLFWFNIKLILINLLGALFFGVGVIITLPATMIALAHVYRQLDSFTQPEEYDTAGTVVKV
jgi:uncharacterized membrane protein